MRRLLLGLVVAAAFGTWTLELRADDTSVENESNGGEHFHDASGGPHVQDGASRLGAL